MPSIACAVPEWVKIGLTIVDNIDKSLRTLLVQVKQGQQQGGYEASRHSAKRTVKQLVNALNYCCASLLNDISKFDILTIKDVLPSKQCR